MRMMGAAPRPKMIGDTVTDLTALDQNTAAAMDATNIAVLACASMAPTDVQQWNGIYASWQTLHASIDAQLQQLTQGSAWNPLNWGGDIATLLQLSSYQQQIGQYASVVPTWQQRVQMACPNYKPAPLPPVLPPSGLPAGQKSIADTAKEIGKVVGVTALAVVGAYALYKVVEIGAPIVAAKLSHA